MTKPLSYHTDSALLPQIIHHLVHYNKIYTISQENKNVFSKYLIINSP